MSYGQKITQIDFLNLLRDLARHPTSGKILKQLQKQNLPKVVSFRKAKQTALDLIEQILPFLDDKQTKQLFEAFNEVIEKIEEPPQELETIEQKFTALSIPAQQLLVTIGASQQLELIDTILFRETNLEELEDEDTKELIEIFNKSKSNLDTLNKIIYAQTMGEMIRATQEMIETTKEEGLAAGQYITVINPGTQLQ